MESSRCRHTGPNPRHSGAGIGDLRCLCQCPLAAYSIGIANDDLVEAHTVKLRKTSWGQATLRSVCSLSATSCISFTASCNHALLTLSVTQNGACLVQPRRIQQQILPKQHLLDSEQVINWKQRLLCWLHAFRKVLDNFLGLFTGNKFLHSLLHCFSKHALDGHLCTLFTSFAGYIVHDSQF